MKKLSLIILAMSLIVSCGNESGDSGSGSSSGNSSDYNSAPSTESGSLTGTAAIGAPVPNAIVKIKCASGSISDGETDGFGKYKMKVDSAGCTGPFIIRVIGTSGGKAIDLLSVADTEDVGAIVNVSPLSHIISANVLGNSDPEDAFTNVAASTATKSKINSAKDKVKTKLDSVIKAATGKTDISDIDLMNTAFATDHTGIDAILDVINFTLESGGNVKLIFPGGVEDSFDPTDNTALEDSSTVDTVDTSKVEAVVDIYSKLNTTLEGLIEYVQDNAKAINESSTVSDLPSGYSDYFHSSFLSRGMDARGALRQWFGLDNYSEYQSNLEGKDASFSNIRLDLLPNSTTQGTIYFDFALDGDIQEKAINLPVAKEGDSWKMYGDQFDFDWNVDSMVAVLFEYKQLLSSGTKATVAKSQKVDFWIEEDSDLGNLTHIHIYDADDEDTPILTVDIADVLTNDGDSDTSLTSGVVTGDDFGYEYDVSGDADFSIGNNLYKIVFADNATHGSISEAKSIYSYMYKASLDSNNEPDVDFPTMTYTNQGDSTSKTIDYSDADTGAEFCGKNDSLADDANVTYAWTSSNDQQNVKFSLASDVDFDGFWKFDYNSGTQNSTQSDDYDSDYPSGGIDLAWEFDGNTNQKSFGASFYNINGIEMDLEFRCNYYSTN